MWVNRLSSPVPVVAAGCTHKPKDSVSVLFSRGICVLSCWCCTHESSGWAVLPGEETLPLCFQVSEELWDSTGGWGAASCCMRAATVADWAQYELEPATASAGQTVRNGLPAPAWRYSVKSHFLIYCFLWRIDWFSQLQDFFTCVTCIWTRTKCRWRNAYHGSGMGTSLLLSGVCKSQLGLIFLTSRLHFPHLLQRLQLPVLFLGHCSIRTTHWVSLLTLQYLGLGKVKAILDLSVLWV